MISLSLFSFDLVYLF